MTLSSKPVEVTQADHDLYHKLDGWIVAGEGGPFLDEEAIGLLARHRLHYSGGTLEAVQRLIERGKVTLDSEGYLVASSTPEPVATTQAPDTVERARAYCEAHYDTGSIAWCAAYDAYLAALSTLPLAPSSEPAAWMYECKFGTKRVWLNRQSLAYVQAERETPLYALSTLPTADAGLVVETEEAVQADAELGQAFRSVWQQARENHERYSATGDREQDLRFFTIGACGEAGELANFVKKRWRDGDGHELAIRHELADICAYTFMAADNREMRPEDLIATIAKKQQAFIAKMEARSGG